MKNNKNGIADTLQYDPRSEVEAPDPVTWQFWKSRRYTVVLLAFFGFFNVYSLRVNLSIAIVAMTEERNVTLANGTTITERDFDWDSKQQGLLLSSFFYGYILTQLAGGYLGSKIGGHLVFAGGIGITALLTLVTPIAAHTNFYLLLAVRITEGFFEGVTFPCIHAIWSKWAPPLERSRMAGIAFAGNYAGTVIAMSLCGIIARAWGWESIFYVFGTFGCLWFIAFVTIVKEGPEFDPYISEKEKNYILASLDRKDNDEKQPPIPWKEIFKSTAVWAIVVCHFSENWGFYTLLTQLPTFLKDTLEFDLSKTGFLSAVPYLTMGSLMFLSGYLADWVQVKGYLTTTQVRKYFNCGSFLAQTIFMMLAAYFLDRVWTIVCITIAVGCGAFAWSGFIVNHLDIAPQFASILMGISNTFATIPGIVSPTLTGYIVQNKSKSEWTTVFYITAAIYCVGCIFYWIFCSGEIQPWAKIEKRESIEKAERNGHFNQGMEMKD